MEARGVDMAGVELVKDKKSFSGVAVITWI
jgi:hypothetical protein